MKRYHRIISKQAMKMAQTRRKNLIGPQNKSNTNKCILNIRGSVTPFAIIIATTFLGIFLLMFSSLQSISYKNTQNDYLTVASDDLLSSFDEFLLTDYGILAYDNDQALEKIKSSITLNTTANEDSYFIKELLIDDAVSTIEYLPKDTVLNKSKIANVCIDISELHVPLEAFEELNRIYSWSDSIKKDVQAYEKINQFAEGLRLFDDALDEISSRVDDINSLSNIDPDWFDETETSKINQSLSEAYKNHKSLLNLITQYEEDLDSYGQAIPRISSGLGRINKKELIESIEASIEGYSRAITGEDHSIDDLKEQLRDNKKIIRSMMRNGAYEDFGDLETDFYIFEGPKKNKKTKKMKDFIARLYREFKMNGGDAPKGYAIWNARTHYEGEKVDLYPDEKILLNEYFLATLKSNVESSVRNFAILTRDERASHYPSGEVEYLIIGTENNKDAAIKLRIFGLRMGPNTLHIIADKEKFNLAKKAGTIIGAAYPGSAVIVTVVVITGWAGIESAYDVDQLLDGKGLPILKDDGSWHYDIDFDNYEKIEKNTSNKSVKKKPKQTNDAYEETTNLASSDNWLSYYNDYLRMLLLMTSDDKKMDRFLRVMSRNKGESKYNYKNLEKYIISHEITWDEFHVESHYYED